MRKAALILLALLLAVGLSSCRPVRPLPVASPMRDADKVLVIVYENKGPSQIPKGAPYLNWLAYRYGFAANYKAITHPSQPNYVAMVFGSTMGIVDDGYKPVHGATILGNAIKAGRHVKNYAESMGSNCRTKNVGPYRQKHEPWTTAIDERSLCQHFDVDAKAFPSDVANGNLPNVGFLIPNICNDAHDCPLSTFNKWLERTMKVVFSGRDWREGRLVVVVTADEDNRKEGNRVYTAVVHPALYKRVVKTPLNHYSLHRSLARFGGTPPLRNGAKATDLLREFGK